MPLTSSSRVGAGWRTLRFLKPRDDDVDCLPALLDTKLVYINLLCGGDSYGLRLQFQLLANYDY